MWGAWHTNKKSLNAALVGLQWARDNGITPAVTEHRGPDDTADFHQFYGPFIQNGAQLVTTLEVKRNVNAGDFPPPNPQGRWGVRSHSKEFRGNGSCWTTLWPDEGPPNPTHWAAITEAVRIQNPSFDPLLDEDMGGASPPDPVPWSENPNDPLRHLAQLQSLSIRLRNPLTMRDDEAWRATARRAGLEP